MLQCLIHPGAISKSMRISWNVCHWGTLLLEFLLLNSEKDTLLVKFQFSHTCSKSKFSVIVQN